MGEVVNLKRARKAKARAAAAAEAATNRASFGRSKVERDTAEAVRRLEDRRHQSHRLEQDPEPHK